jgi:diguanylate cyclase (GGDEF)-like protein
MRILLAEDEPVSRHLLQVCLTGWGYEIVVVADGTEAWQQLERGDGPSIAIIDWMMPGMDGLEICRRVRAQGREPYVYVLLLTERHQQDDVVAGLKSGADDFMTKPFDDGELRARLKVAERIVLLQTELVAAREAMRSFAVFDALTGLPNRTAILQTLAKELNRSRRERAALSVGLVDLDHFKQVNDTHGHLAGDAVLRQAAVRMQASLRSYEAVGRWGGEEFLIVLPGCDAAVAHLVTDRVRAAVAADPVPVEGTAISFTCSVGFATTCDGQMVQPLELVSAADLALYRAKANGRNRVESAEVAHAG